MALNAGIHAAEIFPVSAAIFGWRKKKGDVIADVTCGTHLSLAEKEKKGTGGLLGCCWVCWLARAWKEIMGCSPVSLGAGFPLFLNKEVFSFSNAAKTTHIFKYKLKCFQTSFENFVNSGFTQTQDNNT